MIPKSFKRKKPEANMYFTGPPIYDVEARKKWPTRYLWTSKKSETIKKRGSKKKKGNLEAISHYDKALVNGVLYSLNDDIYVQAKGEPNRIAKIIELFEGLDGEGYFRAQLFYRAEDTVIQDLAGEYLQEKQRVFLSNVEADNSLNLIVSKVHIIKLPAKVLLENEERNIPACDFFYDTKYNLEHLTFSSADNEISNVEGNDSNNVGSCNKEKYMLDLYSGCGAMSTGLCMGASLSGVNLITKWAVDNNSFACESLELNHPETEVINESAEDFLRLLKEWRRLCQKFSLIPKTEPLELDSDSEDDNESENDVEGESDGYEMSPDEFEVDEVLSICYGDPKKAKVSAKKVKPSALYFKVHWKGYKSEEDTWEPYDGLGKCKEKLKEFVTKGFKSKLLPLPEDVHIVCGGPPCQGLSGFNRFRNKDQPLQDEKNNQVTVFMDIIDYLKPKYVLMENVVSLLGFAKGFVGRYAVSRLVNKNYQARLGIMAAGAYGVPQCRYRVFLWGAQPTEKLPPYPLPTHKMATTRKESVVPRKFKELKVGHNRSDLQLKTALTLGDAINDLPEVTNFEEREAINYDIEPETEFQRFISLPRVDTLISNGEDESQLRILYDHQPLQMNKDDYQRACNISKKKGAYFTDLGGVVFEDKTVRIDPSVERVILPSGKPMVPNYAITYRDGKSKKPFGRLWYDEIINTVVTRAQPHNQCVLHPKQNRVLSARENARLQGFPDCYRLYGPVDEKYIQVGNAVAVPVGVALGYAFGMASQRLCDDKPVIDYPFMYPECLKRKEDSD
ncbi:Bromo adjacent homology (BAH) domain [Arabidopsis thaliana x Arabidopsis arenosa]|uniref:Bromo adjacent homology (BAH) domain n=1 Tax=Arabidopsis thaliana x Arabidopsis arenosa TaxID=1240361 RepID=A0A8T2BIQ9_9BRAS|nr:Bromo adjacent homology (BAH) domain [Arabidopsis thaliana x Arabidopsis arenosa]